MADDVSCNFDFKLAYVADDTFGLKPYMMKPHPGQNPAFQERIFNERLSRAMRLTGNAFGIMAARFRILEDLTIIGTVEKVEIVTKARFYLHNFLLKANRETIAHHILQTNRDLMMSD